MAMEKKWFAVYTKPRHEKKVAELFELQGIEYYLPLVKTLKQWSDRKKKVEETLIKSYIFVKTNFSDFPQIVRTNGVINFVKFEKKEAAIPEAQIQALKIFVNNDVEYSVTNEHFKKGQKVKITQGVLKDIEGELVSFSGKTKLYIRIEHIGYGLLAEVNSAFVEVL